jgi:fatty-acyl-CoA synthase
MRTLRLTVPIAKNPRRIFPLVIAELAEKYGDAPALMSDREQLSYRELSAQANRYARWAFDQGVRKGDTVCLLMSGRPEFLAVWIGITRIGGVTALLNTNLVDSGLAYCINVVEPKHIVVEAQMFKSLESARAHLTGDAKIWLHGDAGADLPRIDRAVAALSGKDLAPSDRPALTIEDRALYIYTSGTTGLPKAANLNHYRVMLAAHAFAGVMNTRASDRMYDCLPLYHTVGGLLATGALLLRGGSVVIRDRFSAHEFWHDIARWECTCFQYIGELCRYLLHATAQPEEHSHRLRFVATACVPTSGSNFSSDFASRRSSSSMARPKATSRCSISTARRVRSAGCHGGSPIALRSRSFVLTPSASSPSAMNGDFASNAPLTRLAKSSARS